MSRFSTSGFFNEEEEEVASRRRTVSSKEVRIVNRSERRLEGKP